MVPEDLLFWIAPMAGTPHDDQNVLCLRHADAMSVPRGWTLDDRREEVPRLFMPRQSRPTSATPRSDKSARPARRSRPKRAPRPARVEQLIIDGTGEIARPELTAESADRSPADPPRTNGSVEIAAEPDRSATAAAGADDASWRPTFDQGTDLDGLLEVSSPLLARAFRGTDRPRG